LQHQQKTFSAQWWCDMW